MESERVYTKIHSTTLLPHRSIKDSAPARYGADAKRFDFESECDDWLYPPNVDPSDEDTLTKLAIAIRCTHTHSQTHTHTHTHTHEDTLTKLAMARSLEPEHPRPFSTYASSLLRQLCSSFSGMMQTASGARCIPTVHLLMRLVTHSSLRDDGTSMAFLARRYAYQKSPVFPAKEPYETQKRELLTWAHPSASRVHCSPVGRCR